VFSFRRIDTRSWEAQFAEIVPRSALKTAGLCLVVATLLATSIGHCVAQSVFSASSGLRYATQARSRFEFLLPPVGQSPEGDTPLDVVLRFVADPKLRIWGSDFARRP
jgi:hypothetical protein